MTSFSLHLVLVTVQTGFGAARWSAARRKQRIIRSGVPPWIQKATGLPVVAPLASARQHGGWSDASAEAAKQGLSDFRKGSLAWIQANGRE
jgi:hypothetical protein